MHWLRLGPVFRQVDEVDQFPQSSLVTPIEGKRQSRQMAEVTRLVFGTAVRVLVVTATQAQVGKPSWMSCSAASLSRWCMRITNWFFSQRLEW